MCAYSLQSKATMTELSAEEQLDLDHVSLDMYPMDLLVTCIHGCQQKHNNSQINHTPYMTDDVSLVLARYLKLSTI